MEQATGNTLTIIDRSLEVFKDGSAILLANQTRAGKALVVAEKLLSSWDAAYGLQDPEQRREALLAVDARSNTFLANCGVAKGEMEDARKAITQLMDAIKKLFTEEENKLDVKRDTLPAKVQTRRNQFAREEMLYQEQQRKAAEVKAAKAREEADVRAYIKNAITNCLLTFLSEKKAKMMQGFNGITLESFLDKSIKLERMDTSFPKADIGKIIEYKDPVCKLLDFTAYNTIRTDEHTHYDFESMYSEYNRQVTELKQQLIDRLPSKKEELQEQKRIADAAEAARLAEVKRQEEAEAARQAAIAKASAAQKEKLEREAEEARKRDAERMADMAKQAAAEKALLEEQQQRREAEEAERLRLEDEAAKLKAEQDAEMQRSAATATALFDQTADTSSLGSMPETRNGFEITVLHPAGWVELFQFWFTREATSLSIEDIGKKSLNQMKTFAENAAKKAASAGRQDMIVSKNLKYETSVKSVNRKAK